MDLLLSSVDCSPVNCSKSQMDLSTLLPVLAQPIPASSVVDVLRGC